MKYVGMVNVFFFFLVVVLLVRAITIVTLWEWLIVPSFGLEAVTSSQVMAALMIFSVARGATGPTKEEDDSKFWEDFFAICIANSLGCAISLAIGFVLRFTI